MRPLDPRLLRRARAARAYLAVTVALGLLTTALILVQAGLLARLLSGAARGTPAAALSGALIALLVVLAARAATAYGGEVTALRAAARVSSQLRRALAEHALRLGPAWLGAQQPGEITTVATKGLDALDGYFARYLPQLVLACLVPLAVLARVATADWLSAVVIAVTLPIIPVFAVLVGLQTKAKTQRQWALLARLGGHFLDVVEGLPTLKVFGRAKAQAEVIGAVTNEHRVVTMATLRIAFLSALVLELAATLATAVVAVEVGLRLLAGHLSYQTALLVLLLTPEVYLPLRAAGLHFHASREGAAAAGQILVILDQPLPAPAGRTPVAPGAMTAPAHVPDLRLDTITCDDVWLRYPGRARPALAGLNVTIRPGERIAITGASGAGKSSLLALLLRFTEPSSGRIEAGGTDLARIDADAWRRQIAWVPQQAYLFAGTAAENIALGEPGASRADVMAAAGLAGAAAFIEALPDGYDTPLGERGARLSAGQRQRIALARAFFRDAPLLLLDEPAAHLDPVSAGELAHTLHTLMDGRTVLLVTHGPSALDGVHRTMALSDGHIVQHLPGCAAGAPAPRQPAAAVTR
jgi:ATP-binding cassette, subfamily C, bacterial CydD